MGGSFWKPCRRFPMTIPICPTCGMTIEFFRGIKKMNPREFFGVYTGDRACKSYCPVCEPPEKAYFMWVGQDYTPVSFVEEAQKMGVSKRIHRVPDDMVRGDWVWLGYKKLFKDDDGRGFIPGVFFAFKVTDIHKIISDEQAEDEDYVKSILEKGMTPVVESCEEDCAD